ncbi:prephenate dehydrogenase/arogenate dehydrogenase family protein, partial [Lyngbya confervoides]
MQIGIVGLGLIGGSLGLDLRETGHRVYGLSRSSQSCELAQAMGAVDEAATVPEILKNLDMVVLCTPIGSMVKVFHHIQPYLASETVVTDVGSVKASVVNSLEPLWPNFLGAHPMAGKAEAGIQAAQRHLFLNRPFVVTPTPRTDPVAQARVQDLVAAVGGTLHFADPQSHDQAVALISHLPIFVSAGLLTGCLQTEDSAVLTLAKSLAST